MADTKERFFESYYKFMEILFYLFLFGTLSFGRAFSILRINTPGVPLFITEIFLFLNIPLLIIRRKDLIRFPGIFLISLLAFFLFGSFLLLKGLFTGNMLALRDITLCGYILFLPITLILVNNLSKARTLIAVILISNIINLCLGICVLTGFNYTGTAFNFISQIKAFNLALYYAIAASLIFSFYSSIKPRIYKLIASIGMALNAYMLIIFSKSSVWLATISMFLFLFLMLKKKFLKLLFFFIPFFIMVSIIAAWLCFRAGPAVYRESISDVGSELKAYNMLLDNKSDVSMAKYDGVDIARQVKSGEVLSVSQINAININWRLSIWKQTLKFCLDSPLIGKGFGVYPVYEITSTRQHPKSIYYDPNMVPAHNDLLTVLMKMGIVGLALFLVINISAFVYALSYLKRCSLIFIKYLLTALLGAFIFWHVLALFFDVIDSPPTSVFLWVIMGLIFAAIEIDKSSIDKRQKPEYNEALKRAENHNG